MLGASSVVDQTVAENSNLLASVSRSSRAASPSGSSLTFQVESICVIMI
jgi:hypothetical protein